MTPIDAEALFNEINDELNRALELSNKVAEDSDYASLLSSLGEIAGLTKARYMVQDAPVVSTSWNVITKRPMDEEERREGSEKRGYDIEYDDAYIYGNLPDDGVEVLVCTKFGHIYIDTLYEDECGVYFEDTGDMDCIVAWMYLPEPYRVEKE